MGWEQPSLGWVSDVGTATGSRGGSWSPPSTQSPGTHVPGSAVHADLCEVRRTLKPACSDLGPTLAALLRTPPSCPSLPASRRSWRKNRNRKALVQQIHKSFHSMIIYELDHKLMTVALKKEFLAAEQLA